MSDERDWPAFVRESLGDDVDGAPERPTDGVVEALSGLLETRAPGRDSRDRLLARVESLPQRYAPFFDLLMEMYDLDEAGLESELARAGDPARWGASGLPGVRIFRVAGGPRVVSAQTLLVRFGAGMRFPRHRHRSPERTLILEGGYEDELGRAFHPGDFDDREIEPVHSFRAFPDAPCIAASVHHGFDFEFWPLRAFARLLGH